MTQLAVWLKATGELVVVLSMLWLISGSLIYVALSATKGQLAPVGARRLARARQWLGSRLSEDTLGEDAMRRAAVLYAQCRRWQVRVGMAIRLPVFAMILGFAMYFAAVVGVVTRDQRSADLRVSSIGVLVIGTVVVALADVVFNVSFDTANPRLAVAGRVALIATTMERDVATAQGRDRLVNRLTGLTRVVQRLFLVLAPAGDPDTRAVLVGVSAGLNVEIQAVKRAVLLDPDIAPAQVRDLLWRVLASAAGEPDVMRWAIGRSEPQSDTHGRRRLLTQTTAVVAVSLVTMAVVAVFALDRAIGGNVFVAIVPVVLGGLAWLIQRAWAGAFGAETATDHRRPTNDLAGAREQVGVVGSPSPVTGRGHQPNAVAGERYGNAAANGDRSTSGHD